MRALDYGGGANPVREAIERRIAAGPSSEDPTAGYEPCEDDTPELTAAAMASAALWVDVE